jgi:hypothetical protein
MGIVPNPSAPPPPPAKNTRKHRRFEMYASVELHADGETVILPAGNISLGGAYLTADGHDLSGFPVGSELALLVFDALDEKNRPVHLIGQVVRHDDSGMALMWSTADVDTAYLLARLLETMQAKPGAAHPSDSALEEPAATDDAAPGDHDAPAAGEHADAHDAGDHGSHDAGDHGSHDASDHGSHDAGDHGSHDAGEHGSHDAGEHGSHDPEHLE